MSEMEEVKNNSDIVVEQPTVDTIQNADNTARETMEQHQVPVPPAENPNDSATKSETSSWESLYGDVVWAKFGTFPWWPCCIVDPKQIPLTEKDNARRQGLKSVGKTYTIYFYADKTLGFAPAAKIKPFTKEITEQMRAQKISKGYQQSFIDAIVEAEAELNLEKNNRLSWYLSPPKEELEAESEEENEEESNSIDKQPTKKKRGRPPKDGNQGQPVKKKPKKVKRISLEDEIEDPDINDDELPDVGLIDDISEEWEQKEKRETVEDEEDALKESESESESELEEEDVSDFEKTHKKLKKTKRLSKLKKTSSANDSEEQPKRRGRPRKSDVTDETKSPAPPVVQKKEKLKTVEKPKPVEKPPVKNQFDKETPEQRRNRLFLILKQTTEDPDEVDEERALKTMNKIKELNLSFDELKSSGIGKYVSDLKKHESSDIAKLASQMFNEWKAQAAANKPKTEASAPALPSDPRLHGTERKDSHPTPQIAKKELTLNDLSEDIKKNVSRFRAIKLFHSILKNVELSQQLENAILATFNLETESQLYYEATTRFYLSLKEKGTEEAKKQLTSNFIPLENSEEQQQRNQSFVRNSFSYIPTFSQ